MFPANGRWNSSRSYNTQKKKKQDRKNKTKQNKHTSILNKTNKHNNNNKKMTRETIGPLYFFLLLFKQKYKQTNKKTSLALSINISFDTITILVVFKNLKSFKKLVIIVKYFNIQVL